MARLNVLTVICFAGLLLGIPLCVRVVVPLVNVHDKRYVMIIPGPAHAILVSRPYITERLLMGQKESNQIKNSIFFGIFA